MRSVPPVNDPVFRDPSPTEFADSLFGWMRAMIAAADARAEKCLALKAERRRKQSREAAARARARGAAALPTTLDRVLKGHRCKRVELEDGFRIEARDDDYRPYIGDLLHITYTGPAGGFTATRKPRPGRREQPHPVTLHGATRLLQELTETIAARTREPEEVADSCTCPFIPYPPCSFCESAQYCEPCEELVPWQWWDEHLEEHRFHAGRERAARRHRHARHHAHLRRHRTDPRRVPTRPGAGRVPAPRKAAAGNHASG